MKSARPVVRNRFGELYHGKREHGTDVRQLRLLASAQAVWSGSRARSPTVGSNPACAERSSELRCGSSRGCIVETLSGGETAPQFSLLGG